MTTIFSKEDFKLCDVPVPSGYPQSQTHCSISIKNDNFYLSTSPYPARMKKYLIYFRAIIRKLSFKLLCNELRAECYENPCIYKAQGDSMNTPIKFVPMNLKPLMDTPDPCYGYPAFNSDPELLIEGEKIYIINRSTYRKEKGYVNRLYLIEGVDDNNWFKLLSIKLLIEEQRAFMSPCVIKHNNQYIMTYLDTNSYNDGKTYRGMYYTRLDSLAQLASVKIWNKIDVNFDEYLPWHMSLFSESGRIYAIVACTKKGETRKCWQMLGEFTDDLSSLRIYKTPLTDYNSYRSSAIVHDGNFILYNATVDEKIPGGKSVDGREIIVAEMPFEEVLSRLKRYE